MRSDGRTSNDLRPVKITPHFLSAPAGSCLIEMGKTRVICSVMVENSVPHFLRNSGKGWVTAEYSMLPGSSPVRIQRERAKLGGRTQEIQRLIGRSLRNCIDMPKLGERSLLIDCDVIDADGGTRTAAITGAYVALALAARKVQKEIPSFAASMKEAVAAVSVGIVKGKACLDLHYDDDVAAEVDMNVVKTASGKFVEIQGTGETAPFDQAQLDELLALANAGIEQLFAAQREALGR